MADTISAVAVDGFQSRWGTTIYDYKLNGVATDFQDLMVAVSEHRATAVEGEVEPLSTRMRARNKYLDELGASLAELTAAQATLDSDAEGDDRCSYTFSSAAKTTVKKATGHNLDNNETKSWLEYFVQSVKSAIDSENNAAQTDMTRLQSLVDRRDESFTTATTLMTNVSDTRSNAIRNM